MNQQLGSLQLDNNLINNWLGTSLSTNSSSSTSAIAPSLNPLTSDLFSGLNGGLSKVQSQPTEPAVTSANPFLAPTSSATAANGTFSQSTFGSFSTSFPSGHSDTPATPAVPTQNQSDFSNLNWANFNQVPAIPTGGPSTVPSSVLPTTNDLWQ